MKCCPLIYTKYFCLSIRTCSQALSIQCEETNLMKIVHMVFNLTSQKKKTIQTTITTLIIKFSNTLCAYQQPKEKLK